MSHFIHKADTGQLSQMILALSSQFEHTAPETNDYQDKNFQKSTKKLRSTAIIVLKTSRAKRSIYLENWRSSMAHNLQRIGWIRLSQNLYLTPASGHMQLAGTTIIGDYCGKRTKYQQYTNTIWATTYFPFPSDFNPHPGRGIDASPLRFLEDSEKNCSA